MPPKMVLPVLPQPSDAGDDELKAERRREESGKSSRSGAPPGSDECCTTMCSIIAPVIRAMYLNSNPTASILVPDAQIFVIGKQNGELVFIPFAIDPTKCTRHTPWVVRNKSVSKFPISAIAYGRRTSFCQEDEIVSISSNGFLQVIRPPKLTSDAVPIITFTQMIHANIMSAFMYPIDRRTHYDLTVIMTDRVVRTYRWNDSAHRFTPVGKWELTGQIMAVAIGDTPFRGIECWAKLSSSRCFVSCRLGEKKTVSIHQMATETPDLTLIMPYRCYFVDVFQPKVEEVIVYANMRERRLYCPVKDVSAISVLRMANLNIVVTSDAFGHLFIYGYNEKTIKRLVVPPILELTSLPEIMTLAICEYERCVIIAVSSLNKKVQIHYIHLDFIHELVAKVPEEG